MASIAIVPGAGGGPINPAIFQAGARDATCVQTIVYPGWRRYIDDSFSMDILIKELAAQIVDKCMDGPIHIIGSSLGGHFAYAAALHLAGRGHAIAGFCAVDSYMQITAEASSDWKQRAFMRGLELLRQRQLSKLIRFLRSRLWRALVKLPGEELPALLNKFSAPKALVRLLTLDPIFEAELDMRLLLLAASPWVGALDRPPAELRIPSILLRTRRAAGSDEAWRRRCPQIKIFEIPGDHHTFLNPENVASFREAFVRAARESYPTLAI